MARPRRSSDEPPRLDRRRLLLGIAFGVGNVALVRALPDRRPAGAVEGDQESPALGGRPAPAPDPDRRFELVIRGGRVVDPETGFDATVDVGIDGGTIQAIDAGPLPGGTVLDAGGRVVAPGFIDVLSYDPNPFGIWFKIADGVTTNLGMHGVNADAGQWFGHWEREGSPCHFGGAFDVPWARAALGLRPDQAADATQLEHLAAQARAAVEAGWVGIDVEPEYTPGAETAELEAMARVAADLGVPLFVHARYSDVQPPGTNAEALAEVVGLAERTGAAVHVEHIVSTGGTFSMEESLATLATARRSGLDLTACTYPYDFWATYLGSARFAPGWQERFRIGFADLQLAGTGERLTAESFARYRAENRLAVAHAIPEVDVRAALRAPFVLVASDAILEPEAENHPRAAGTFARTLGRYVREEGVLDLTAALAKMTLQPARRLEARAPALRRKGRLQVGADADVVVFDPETVRDRATVAEPARPSVGMDWVVVGGQVVKDPDGVRRDVRPGRAIRFG